MSRPLSLAQQLAARGREGSWPRSKHWEKERSIHQSSRNPSGPSPKGQSQRMCKTTPLDVSSDPSSLSVQMNLESLDALIDHFQVCRPKSGHRLPVSFSFSLGPWKNQTSALKLHCILHLVAFSWELPAHLHTNTPMHPRLGKWVGWAPN